MPRRKDESEDSDEQDDDSLDEEKIQIRKPKIDRIDKFKTLKKITINVSMTQYPVVTEVADDLGWKVQTSNDAGDWDVYWTDFSVDPDVLIKMHLFQKINHFPGIHMIARKNLLGTNLTNMGKLFPEQYNFFPMTWMLPQQYSEFRQYYQSKQKGKTRTFIVKPQADCQGRGIFLTRKIQDMQTGKHYVVQRYMARPYLLEGLKFDMRIYVLMCGTDPLKLYLYNEGLARLATEQYHEPMNANLDRLCMHLTNYAINKHNPNFIFNNNVNNMGIGHKRALSCLYKQLAQKGLDVDKLKQKIKDIIIKTIISGLPLMAHQYKFSQPEDYSGNMCFHILGLDVMINSKGQPSVIQVNHTPSFTTDTPLDHKIKFNLIKDTLVLMNVNVKQKTQLFNRCKQYNAERLMTGKRHIYQGQDRQEKIRQAQLQRQKYESKHLGGFQKIFPLDDPQKNKKYEQMIGASMKIYLQENTAVKARYQDKEMKKLMRSQLKNMKKFAKQKDKPQATDSMSNPQLQNKSMPPQMLAEIEKQLATPKATPRDQDLTMSQPAPSLVETQIDHFKKQIIKKIKKMDQNQINDQGISKVNHIRTSAGRDPHTSTAQRKEKSQKTIQNSRLLQHDKLRATSKRQTPTSQLKRVNKNIQAQAQKQLPNIEANGGFTELIQSVQHLKKKKILEKSALQNRFLLKSQPKAIKLLQSIQRQARQNYDRKLSSSGNGGFVMPKIFAINVDAQKKDKERDQLNFLTMGRKIQSSNFSNNG